MLLINAIYTLRISSMPLGIMELENENDPKIHQDLWGFSIKFAKYPVSPLLRYFARKPFGWTILQIAKSQNYSFKELSKGITPGGPCQRCHIVAARSNNTGRATSPTGRRNRSNPSIPQCKKLTPPQPTVSPAKLHAQTKARRSPCNGSSHRSRSTCFIPQHPDPNRQRHRHPRQRHNAQQRKAPQRKPTRNAGHHRPRQSIRNPKSDIPQFAPSLASTAPSAVDAP